VKRLTDDQLLAYDHILNLAWGGSGTATVIAIARRLLVEIREIRALHVPSVTRLELQQDTD